MDESIEKKFLPPTEAELASPNRVAKFCESLITFLMNSVVLTIGGSNYRFLELEVYLTDSNKHNDPYVHGQPFQFTSGNFYLHSRVNGKTKERKYLESRWAGMDMTFGGAHVAGGILVRSFQNIANGKISCGPGQCMETVTKLCGVEKVAQLAAQMKDFRVSNASNPIFLQQTKLEHLEVYSCPRVGLHLTKEKVPVDVQMFFSNRFYRFLVKPQELWKGKHTMVIALWLDKMTTVKIAQITGLDRGTVEEQVGAILKGRNLKDISSYVGRRLTEIETLVVSGYHFKDRL